MNDLLIHLWQIEAVRGALRMGALIFLGAWMDTTQALLDRIDLLLASMEQRLGVDAKTKTSVADYMRLIQFRRELADEVRPREIKVSWSDSLEEY